MSDPTQPDTSSDQTNGGDTGSADNTSPDNSGGTNGSDNSSPDNSGSDDGSADDGSNSADDDSGCNLPTPGDDGDGDPSTDPSASSAASDTSTDSNVSNDSDVHVARTSGDLDHANALALSLIRIRVFDTGCLPLANTPYHLTVGDQQWTDTTDGDGWIEQHVQSTSAQGQLEWGAGTDPGTYLYTQNIHLDYPDSDAQEATSRRLQNLGYSIDGGVDSALAAFCNDHNLTSDNASDVLQQWHTDPTAVQPRQSSSPDSSPPASSSPDSSPSASSSPASAPPDSSAPADSG